MRKEERREHVGREGQVTAELLREVGTVGVDGWAKERKSEDIWWTVREGQRGRSSFYTACSRQLGCYCASPVI